MAVCFLYFVKSDLPSVRVYSGVHGISQVPEKRGHVHLI